MSNRRKFYEESVKVLKSDAFNSASPEEQEEIRAILKDTYSKIKAREDANIEPTDEEIRAERGTLRNLYGDLEAGHMSLARGATTLAAWTADIAGAKETAGKLDATSAEIAKQMARTSPQASPENLLDFGSQALLQNLPTLAATGLVGRALTGSTAVGQMLVNARMAAGIPAIGGAAPLSAGAAQGIATTAMYGIPAMRQANVEAVPGEIREGNAWQELAAAVPYAAVESYLGVSPAKFVDAFAGKTAGAGISKLFSQYGGKVAKFLEAPLIQLSNKHGALAAIGAGARWIASNIIGEASEEVVQGIMEIAQPIVAKEGLIPGIQKTIAELKKDSVVQNLMVQAYGGGIVGSILGGAGTIQQKIVALNEAQEEMERKGAAVAELQKLAKARANLEAQMKRLQTAGEKLATSVEEEAAIMADLEAEQAAKDEEKLNLAANLGPEKARLLTLRAKLFNGITNLQEAGPRAAKAKSMAEAKEIDYNRASAILQYAMNPVDEQSYNEAVAAFREFPQELQDMVMKDYEAATPEAGQRLAVIPGTWEAKKAAAKQEKAKAKSEKKAARKARLEQQKAQAEQIAKQQAKQLPPDVTVEKVKPTGTAQVTLAPAAKKRGEPMTVTGTDGAKNEKRLAPPALPEKAEINRAKTEEISPKARPANRVILKARDMTGAEIGTFSAEYDGTEKGAAEAMAKLRESVESAGNDISHAYSAAVATDENGNGKFAISPNGKVSAVGSEAAKYTLSGQVAEPKAAEPIKQPTAPAYKVESYQGGFRVLDPQGKQYSWHTSKQAADSKAADLNSGKTAPTVAPKAETKAETKPIEPQQTTRITAENAEMLANAQKLRKSAASLLEQAQTDLSRDRQTNTARRARMAAGATDDAANREAFAKTMNNLADAMERGEVRYLKGVKSRPDLMLFKNELTAARRRYARKNDLTYDQEQKIETTEDIIRVGAEFNRPHPYGDWFDHAARELETIQGMKPAAAYIEKLGRGNRSRNVSLSDEAIGKILDIKKTIAKKGIKTPYQFARILETVEDYQKLRAAGIKSDSDLADALIEYRNLEAGKKQESPLIKAERELIGKKFEGFDFFPTPPALAERMAQELDIKPGMKVLEPSAGKGDLADAVKAAQPEADVKVIEPLSDLREILTMKNHEVIDTNFENFETDQKFDRIIMNPPFSKNRDIRHVRKAYELLAPGGKMVAIMGNHFTFANDKESVEFRDWLDAAGGTSESLGQVFAGKDAFRQTGVNSQLVTIEKPAETSFKAEPGKAEVSGQTVETPPAASDLVKPEEKDFESATDYLKALTAWREKTGNITAAEAKRRDRALRYADRAVKTGQKASGLFRQADKISERFYMGQPILVGHHSERGARAAQSRMHNKIDAALKEEKKAEYYSQRAESAEKNKSISSADEDAIVKLKAKLETLGKVQERMKQANKVVKATKLSDAEKITKLQEQGFSEAKAKNLLEKDFAGRVGFPAYALQNNNAEISRLKKRIEELSVKQSQQTQKIEFDGGEIVDNVAENRLQIFFDSKPDEATREKLKSNGFRWAPSAGAWQMHRSTWANRKAESITGAKIPAAQPAQAATAEDKQEIEPESAKEPFYSAEYLVARYAKRGLDKAGQVVKRGLELIRQTGATFAKWARQMVNQFGQTIKKHLRNLWADLTAVLQSRRGMIRIAGWKSPQMIENIQRVSDRARASQRSMSEISSVYTGMDFRREASINRMGSLSQPMSGDLIDRLEAVGATPYDDNSGVARRNAANRRFREQQAAAYAKIAAKEIIEPVSQRAKEASEAFFKEWLGRFGSRRGAALNLGGDAMTIFLNGATKFADWARALVKKYGKSINGMLKNMWTSVNNFAKSLGRTGAIGGKRPAGSVPKSFDIQSKELQWIKDNKDLLRLTRNGKTLATLERRKPGGWRWAEANKAWARNELAIAKATVKSTIYEELKRSERETAKYQKAQEKAQKEAEAKKHKHDDYFNQPLSSRVSAEEKPLSWKDQVNNFVTKVHDAMYDRWAKGKRLIEAAVTEKNLKEIPESENFYQYLEILANRTANRTEMFKDENFKPIIDYLNKNKISYKEFNRFLRVMHAEERNEHIFNINPEFRQRAIEEPDNPMYAGSGITTKEARAEIEKMLADGTFDKFFEAGAMYWDLNNKLLDLQVKYGLMPADVRDAIKSKYTFYAPLKSMTDDATGLDWRALGRRSESSDQLAHTEKAIDATFSYGENARMRRAFAKFAINNPNPALYEMHRAVKKPYFDENTGEVKYRLDAYADRENMVYVPTSTGAIILTVKDPDLLRILKNQNDAEVGALLPYLRIVNRAAAAMHTAYSPEFMINNLLVDAQGAGIALSAEQSTQLAADVLLGLPSAALVGAKYKAGTKNADTALFKEFIMQGGKTGFRDVHKLADAAKLLEKRMMEAQKGGVVYQTKEMVGDIGRLVSGINDVIEAATRFSTYREAIKAGMSKGKAAALAAGVTINFQKRGTWGQIINTLYLFGTANLGGQLKLATVMASASRTKMGRAAIAGGIALGFMLDLFNRMISDFDPEEERLYWDNLSIFEKDSNYIVMMPGGKDGYVKLPMPRGFNFLPAIGRNLAAMMFGQQALGKTAQNIASAFINTASPIGADERGLGATLTPYVFKLPYDLITNTNWMGKRIRPAQPPFASPKPASELFNPNTNKVLVEITRALNSIAGGDKRVPSTRFTDLSPADVQYVIEYLTGGAGKFIGRSIDAAWRLGAGEPIRASDVPFARRVIGSGRDYSVFDRFAENRTWVKRFAEAKAEKDIAWMQKYSWLGLTIDLFKATDKKLNEIAGNETLTQDQKREAAILEQKRFNREFEQIKKQYEGKNVPIVESPGRPERRTRRRPTRRPSRR